MKVLHVWPRRELTNQSDRIVEVRPGDIQLYKSSDYVSVYKFRSRGVETGLHSIVPNLKSITQDIMSLVDQYAFQGVGHFDLEEVMKVPQILHVE